MSVRFVSKKLCRLSPDSETSKLEEALPSLLVHLLLVAACGILLLAGSAGLGCRSRSAAPDRGFEPQVASAPAEASAPSGRGATPEEIARIPHPPPPEPPPPSGAINSGEGWTTPPAGRTTPGYRVQIFASSQRERAEEIGAVARTRFNVAVYVEYDAPFYKVRVGDCITRAEADAIKEQAIARGYDAPWVAETMVLSR